MSDKRRSIRAKPRALLVETTRETRQKTLLDLFPRKIVSTEKYHTDESQEDAPVHREPEVLTATTFDAHTVNSGITTGRIEIHKSRPKLLYPLFTKRSRPSKASQIQKAILADDIIEVADNELEFKSSPLPGSSLSADSPVPCSLEPGASQEDPIVLDSSPTRPTLPLPPQAPVAPPLTLSAFSPAKYSKDRDTTGVPYPDRNSQHVRGPQQIYSAPHSTYSLRQQSPVNITTDSSSYLLPMVNPNEDMGDPALSTDTMHFLPYTATGKETYLKEIPNEHPRLHPAILRFANSETTHSTTSFSGYKAWTDKWRPTQAEEILGNESNGVYLRDWLRTLELHFDTSSTPTSNPDHLRANGKTKAKEDAKGNKRPRVVRTVEKLRGRKKRRIDSDDEDDWIVYGDESEEEALQADENDGDIGQEAFSRLYCQDSHSDPTLAAPPNHFSQRFSHHLTNTILLAGPSGAGKTAAVYACADELGWEVFEVYPGIGKRNGASIEVMIGDVGKNHLVRKARHRDREAIGPSNSHDAFAKLLRKSKDPVDDKPQDFPSAPGDFGFVSKSINQSGQGTGETSTVRQSLILLEEVDILFKEDSNFWPTIINFIKHCKRPVICTCNDVSLVPTLDLPLQSILTFQACPTPVATSYLQGLCSAEGYLVTRDSLFKLYESTCKCADLPVSSSGMVTDLPVPDLRRTINCLQLRCLTMGTVPPSGRSVQWKSSEYSVEDLSNWNWPLTRQSSSSGSTVDAGYPFFCGPVIDHADLISFVDSQLLQSTSEVFDGPEPSTDDEVGHTILLHTLPTTGNASGCQHEDIASTAMRLSRGVLERKIRQELTSDVNTGFRTHALFRARVEHQAQMAEGLTNKVPLSVWAMRNYVIHMDYGPWVRQIVAEEDMQEALQMKKERPGRQTRNSGKGYERTIAVTAEEREALRVTGL